MLFLLILLWITLGVIAGFFAGAVGIGGGIIVVPSLYWIFTLQGVPESLALQKAIVSSLCIMVFTALSSATSHYFKKGIQFSVVKWVTLGALIGAFLGPLTSSHINTDILKVVLACLEICMGVFLIFKSKMNYEKQGQIAQKTPNRIVLFAFGIIIAFISTLLGIGGGLFMVPAFMLLGYSPQESVGTSTTCVIFLSFMGALYYLLLSKSAGYASIFELINVKTIFFVALGSFIGSPLGAGLCYKLPHKAMRYVLATLLIGVGVTFFV